MDDMSREGLLDEIIRRSPAEDVGASGVDIIVRTSGEVRLSDFMLWQSSFSTLNFVNKCWPQYSLFHLVVGVFLFQMETWRLRKHPEVSLKRTATDPSILETRIKFERLREELEKRRLKGYEQIPHRELW